MRSRSSTRFVTVAGLLAASIAATAACNALIGTRDLSYDGDAAASAEDGGSEAATPNDGAMAMPNEAGADVVTSPCGADLQSDPKSCGKCGHDCSNGNCSGGLCTLATALPSPGTLVVRNGVAYVGLAGGDVASIISCPTTGCATGAVGTKDLEVDASSTYPAKIAVTDTYVFASDFSSFDKGGFTRVLLGGGDFHQFPPATLERSYGIAVDATTVYWMTDGMPGNLHYCTMPDCTGFASATTADQGELVAVASDGNLVWTEGQGFAVMRCDGKSACTPQTITGSVGAVNDLQIVANVAYWGTSEGVIYSCPASGCAAATEVMRESPAATIGALAVSGTTLYWSAMPIAADGNNVLDAEGQIHSCTIGKCEGPGNDVKTLAKTQHDPDGMAVDADSVYWVNSGKRGYIDGIGNLVKAPR